MNLISLTKYQEVFLSFPEFVEQSFQISATKINHKLINEIEYQLIGRNSTCHDILNEVLITCQSKLYEEKRKRNTYLVEERSVDTFSVCMDDHIRTDDKILLLEDNLSTIEYQISRLGLDQMFLNYKELLCTILYEEVLKQKPKLIDLQIGGMGVQHFIRSIVKKYTELYIDSAKRELEINFLELYLQVTEQLINELQFVKNFVLKQQYK